MGMTEPLHRVSDSKLVGKAIKALTRGDWDRLSELAEEASARRLDPPAKYGEETPQPGELQIGDEFTAVIVHPNRDDDRDPVAKVNNKTTFIRFPNKENEHVSFGEAVRVRLADKRRNHNLAVVVEADGDV